MSKFTTKIAYSKILQDIHILNTCLIIIYYIIFGCNYPIIVFTLLWF